MKTPARLVALAACLALSPSPGLGQAAPTPAKLPEDRPEVRELVLSPAAAPVPALKYRLLPISADLRPGDAAPIYLRVRAEIPDEMFQRVEDEAPGWIDKPLAEFPREDARKLIGLFGPARFEQIEFGTNRQACDWGYTLPEQREEWLWIHLDDAQEMRKYWGRLLPLKMRVEVAEGRFDDAVRTARVSLAFARHVARAPFLVNAGFGVVIAEGIAGRIEELIVQPGAPNLYWALTTLPDPPISFRDCLETEQRSGENLVPELADDGHARTDVEWAADLTRLHRHLVRLARTLRGIDSGSQPGPPSAGEFPESLADFRAALLGPARARFPDGLVGENEAIFRHVVAEYQATRDDSFRGIYLPIPAALAELDAAAARSKQAKPGPLAVFHRLPPSAVAIVHSEARLARRVAALRVIEALRLHAHETGAGLPATLDAVKVVPIPLDPGTGRAFDYRRDGDAAVLTVRPLPGTSRPNVSYRITLRR